MNEFPDDHLPNEAAPTSQLINMTKVDDFMAKIARRTKMEVGICNYCRFDLGAALIEC